MAVKLVIDSASDISKKEAEEMGIHMIPMSILFGDKTYMDGVDLSGREFFEKLIETDELPTTSQINMFQFEECFSELTADGSEVVAITLSSKLSGTYAGAVSAAGAFPGKVFVVDSLLQKYLKDSESLWAEELNDVPSYCIGSTIGTHVGPGAIAVAFFAKQNNAGENQSK